MDGASAVLVHNCSGVTFHAELCMELHSANKEYGDVALRDKGEAREPRTSAFTIYISAGKPTLVTVTLVCFVRCR